MMRCERCGSPPGIRAATAVVAIAAVVALAGQREVGRRAIHDAREATRHEARAREDALRTATEERTRIARELHDVLGHSLG